MVFQRPNPFPKSIYDNVAFAPRMLGMKDDLDEPRRAGAARRGALGRGQGPAQEDGARPLRRPAAAALHRPRARRRARGAPVRRAVLRARPDRDLGDRGPDARPEARVHARDRHAQHAAGRPRRRHDRVLQPRRGRRAGPARLVEFDATSKIFTNPSDSRTTTTSPAVSASWDPAAQGQSRLRCAGTDTRCAAVAPQDRRESGRPRLLEIAAATVPGPSRTSGLIDAPARAADQAARPRSADRDRSGLAHRPRVGRDGYDHEHQEEESIASHRKAFRAARQCRATCAMSPSDREGSRGGILPRATWAPSTCGPGQRGKCRVRANAKVTAGLRWAPETCPTA